MIKRTKVASAINLAVVSSIAAGAFVASSAFAAEETAKVERIEVTGSRIQRQDMETASPVTVIDAAAIKAEGFTSVDQMLQVQTSMAGAAVGSTTNNGADGVAQVDLRGMGSQRTLVLLNGRRMVNSGSGADSAVDLNSIPVAMIARVEILKDGASAVYGSDAIAGVVNIITKKDFEGFQFDMNGSGTDKGDGQSGDVSALYGFSTDSGNYTFGAAYSDRRGVIQGDRNWYDPAENSSSIIPTGSLNTTDNSVQRVLDANGNWVKRTERYDFSDDVYFQTPSERRSLFANMTQELGNDVVLTADAIYTNRRSNQQLAAQPAQIKLNVCGDPRVTDPNAGCINLDQSMVDAGLKADARGQVQYNRRMKDVGPRIYNQDTDTWRLSAGLAGSLDVHTGMNWNVDYTFGKNEAKTGVDNSINATLMANSIYADPYAWFEGSPLTDDMKDVSYQQQSTGGNEQQTLSAGLNGELFDLSAGAVGFAIGAEYRRESGFYNPDPIVVAGDSTAAQQDPTSGNYNVISIFEEVSVPFTEKLTGEFALRLDDYSTFGKATTWKIGLTYTATDELMIRTVAATGFRAPSVAELYGGNSGSFDYLTNPWLPASAQTGQILVNRTSDPDLKPEESESYTAGLVYSPSYIDGMSVTLDYWRFKVTNAIARENVQVGLDACHKGDAEACSKFNITPDGDLFNLTSALTNVGTQDTSGIDLNLAYNFEGLGLDWKIGNDMTYLVNFEQDGENYTGTIDGNFGAYARVRNNFSISAGQDDWSVMYFNRYIGDMRDLNTGDNVGDILYHNISGTYHVNDSTTVSLGVKNFTDETPLYVSNGSDAGTVPQVYDTVGRTIYGGVTVKF